jgi:hypothetical protein
MKQRRKQLRKHSVAAMGTTVKSKVGLGSTAVGV